MIEPRVHATLDPPSPDDELVTTDVGPHGDVVALWKSSAGFRITGHGSVIETELAVEHPQLQPLPDGQVLVVQPRCRWSSKGVAPNAFVLDQDGQVVRSGVFGDGIQHVATTPSGQTWVGYFDEGVFGNLGWVDPGRSPSVPTGSSASTRTSNLPGSTPTTPRTTRSATATRSTSPTRTSGPATTPTSRSCGSPPAG